MNQPAAIAAELHIDLNAVVDNWRALAGMAAGADCAAVVKANAYGLGDCHVVGALSAAGCRTFFVATLDEALAIEPLLQNGERVFVFHGLGRDELEPCRRHGFVPVLSTVEQIALWYERNRTTAEPKPCMLQVDTGMNRLGLELRDWQQLAAQYDAAVLRPDWIMSHLACAEDVDNPLNALQLSRFETVVKQARAWAPAVKASFANSSGIVLGPRYHFDQARPGIALYGGNPELNRPNRFKPVVRLRLPILQLRRVGEDGSVGYGATASVRSGALLATVHSGYADGLLVAQSKSGGGEIDGHRVPMVGRISMDLTIFDVSAVPESVWARDNARYIEVLNDNLTIDDMARAANTISYEILTGLGQRYRRRYAGGASKA